jgi:tetratricopeptide (TPR) repeat protein
MTAPKVLTTNHTQVHRWGTLPAVSLMVLAVFISNAAADDRLAVAERPGAITASQQHIQELIRELGSPRFTARRSAANDLRQIGAEAFDLLHTATDDSDPEIAASASYLLRQIAVKWIQSDDPAAVRLLLREFGQESETARLQRLKQLGRLTDGVGVPALCRIARFDRSPLVSRAAAVEIIRPPEKSVGARALDPDGVERELGASTRVAAKWLRQYLIQQRDPAASLAAWKQLVDAELARADKNASDTSSDIQLDLLWNLADVYRQLGQEMAVAATLDRMMELAADGSDETSINVLEWLTENKSWNVLDAFLKKHQAQLGQSKRPLYYAAMARAKQGQRDVAEQLANSAAGLQAQGATDGFLTAKDLEEHGQFDWAVREYRRAISRQPIDTVEPILARIFLANLLHDYEHEKEAADALEPLTKAVHNEGKVGQLYSKIRQYNNARLDLPDADGIAGRFHFYRACQFQNEKDYERARQSLEDSIRFDPENGDVLIAMYRLPESDAKWRDATRQRIRQLCQRFEEQADGDPTNPSPYNQWAWLVSNTEGDFPKAIRYSRRSLELIPPGSGDSMRAGLLDTLGRCYYAAGDYENAVKCEREAVEKDPYVQVMQRQLATFEKALAEKAGSGEPGAGNSKQRPSK